MKKLHEKSFYEKMIDLHYSIFRGNLPLDDVALSFNAVLVLVEYMLMNLDKHQNTKLFFKIKQSQTFVHLDMVNTNCVFQVPTLTGSGSSHCQRSTRFQTLSIITQIPR